MITLILEIPYEDKVIETVFYNWLLDMLKMALYHCSIIIFNEIGLQKWKYFCSQATTVYFTN